MYKFNIPVKNDKIFRVIKFIMFNPDCTMDTIAANCQVTRKTVSRILPFFLAKSLLYKHLLKERGDRTARAYSICINPKYNYIVYYLNGNHFTVSMIDLIGHCLFKKEIVLKLPLRSKEIIDHIDSILASFTLTRFQFRIGHSFIAGPKSIKENGRLVKILSDRLKAKFENKGKDYPYSKRFVYDTSFNMARSALENRKDFNSNVVMYLRSNINEVYYMIVDADHKMNNVQRVDMSDCKFADESSERTLTLIEKCISEYSVTKIIIDSDDYKYIKGLKRVLKEIATENNSLFMDHINSIIISKSDVSIPAEGAGIRLKEMFYDSIVKKLSD